MIVFHNFTLKWHTPSTEPTIHFKNKDFSLSLVVRFSWSIFPLFSSLCCPLCCSLSSSRAFSLSLFPSFSFSFSFSLSLLLYICRCHTCTPSPSQQFPDLLPISDAFPGNIRACAFFLPVSHIYNFLSHLSSILSSYHNNWPILGIYLLSSLSSSSSSVPAPLQTLVPSPHPSIPIFSSFPTSSIKKQKRPHRQSSTEAVHHWGSQ